MSGTDHLLSTDSLRAIPRKQVGAHGVAVDAHEESGGQQDVQRRQARGPQEVRRRERPARDD